MLLELELPLPPPEWIERMERQQEQLQEIQDDSPDSFGVVDDVIIRM